MPHIKVYIHFVWTTKYRKPMLVTEAMRKMVWRHIRENAREKNIFVDFVGGYDNHCHCLVSLGVDQTIQKTVQLLKGESSFWINKQNLCGERFEWQNDYFSVAVSESVVERVRNYIGNQEAHHKQKTFQDEYNEFLERYGFEKIDNKVEKLG